MRVTERCSYSSDVGKDFVLCCKSRKTRIRDSLPNYRTYPLTCLALESGHFVFFFLACHGVSSFGAKSRDV